LGASTSWNSQDLSRPVMELLYLYLLPVRIQDVNPRTALKSSDVFPSTSVDWNLLRRTVIYLLGEYGLSEVTGEK